MYLMNVPPVAVRQTEWRTCGPPGGYSLQCFNDSDIELSTGGTPISDKVQMIIESLRSTQSSLEMGDEIEENVLPGQDGHPQVCKVAMGSYEVVKPKTTGPTQSKQENVSSPINLESSDSDSDDSVDKGIEAAIAEYLKEKDNHKRKAEPCSTLHHSSKIQRKNIPIPDKQSSDSDAFLIASYPYLKCVKAETASVPAAIPIKKYIKNKASLNDNLNKTDYNKSTMAKMSVFPNEQTLNKSKTIIVNKMKCPVSVKVEQDDSNDSSSDDGIEEAIQRYQLEKQEQQNRKEAFIPHAIKEETDSSTTSDDGIEEAICRYQLEQLKEKSVLKPFIHTNNPCCRPFTHDVGSTSIESMKKYKLKKKKPRAEKEGKPVRPQSAFMPKNLLSESQTGKGNGLLSLKVDSFQDQPTPAPPKVNTSAELMCAEAILDISKTVMPEAFHHSVDLSSCAPAEPSRQSAVPCPNEESDGSSIDSEDGIEQEIRKFLEQKAQMNKQPSSSAVMEEPQSTVDPEKVKVKQVATQKKPSRMSLTQRRKDKEENPSNSNMSGIHNDGKESAPTYLPANRKDVGKPQTGLQKTEQSGDKSSSLDSDEDLDTAIKDLLKTKKKTKKKTRESRKSRTCLKDEEQRLKNVSQPKKLKHDPVSKHSALKKAQKIKDDMQGKTLSSKKTVSHQKQTDESKGSDVQEGETEILKRTEGQDSMSLQNAQTTPPLKEDSSSVDSDDSIEQEIRKFLAEKAKVSTADKSKEGDVSRNGTAGVCSPPQDDNVKEENQLAEIPRKNISITVSGQLLSSSPLPTPQNLVRDISVVDTQSRMPSIQTCSPGLLEPADGAGAGRAEQKKPSMWRGENQDVPSQMERVQPALSTSVAHSCSESIKWRRSLGLPVTDMKTLSRLPFQITSSKINETEPATLPHQSRGVHLSSQTPLTAWSSSRTSRAPFPWSTEKTVNTTHRSVKNLLSSSRQQPRMPLSRSMHPDHTSPLPIEGETKSMVHISKDKSVFVELESDRTNHVQVRSRERNQGKEREDLIIETKKEGECLKIDDKEVHLERKEEKLVDGAGDESGNGRNPEKKQGFSTLSLSSAIDPGISFRPCIALTTEERSQMFSRKYLPEKCKKGKASLVSAPLTTTKMTMQRVKRKLQFVSAGEMKHKVSTAPQNHTSF